MFVFCANKQRSLEPFCVFGSCFERQHSFLFQILVSISDQAQYVLALVREQIINSLVGFEALN